ncbi:hypothetical protein AYI70_g6795 [Smittium culicis]|uniref:Uncharacterized protein n=1 Tax=Smittium culicis TaxID=133412 RepID=A0A1R1XNB4_9FUNG|nr:hypothetical protein AYI70_g6795 [Smittium culicis]
MAIKPASKFSKSAPVQPQQPKAPAKSSLWSAYTSIAPRRRILFGTFALCFATAGLYVSDKLEEMYPETSANSGLGLQVPKSTIEKSL